MDMSVVDNGYAIGISGSGVCEQWRRARKMAGHLLASLPPLLPAQQVGVWAILPAQGMGSALHKLTTTQHKHQVR